MSLSADRKEAAVVFGIGAVIVLAWVMFTGRDLSWDVVNHHLYLPFSLLTGRFTTDLFAAGPQSFQNPIGFVPFYLLLKTGLPSWAIGVVLAVVHASVLLPLHRLSVAIWGTDTESRWWRLMAVAMAGCAPTYFFLAGTSSLEPLSAILVLWALACLLTEPKEATTGRLARRHSGLGYMALSGFLAGLAFAVKPVNAVFVLGLMAVLAVRTATGLEGRMRLAVWLGSAALATAVFMGPWSWWLWHSFGNPLFPLYNQWFGSPFAPQQALMATRFLPQTAMDWISRPLDLALYQGFGSSEAMTADARPLVAGLLLAPGLWLAGRRQGADVRAALARPDLQILVFLVVVYALWMATSGNARYVVAWFMVIGLLVVRLAQIVAHKRAARISLGVLLALQFASLGSEGIQRTPGGLDAWDRGQYIPVEMPKLLVDEPFLHLSIGSLTYASLAMYMHPHGAMSNVIGQMSLPATGPLGDALRERLETRRWAGRTRFLFRAPGVTVENGVASVAKEDQQRTNWLVSRLGLGINFNDCVSIARGQQTLLSCRAVKKPLPEPSRQEMLAELVFDAMEYRCPMVYGPVPMVSESNGDVVQRLYANTDLRVTVSNDDSVTVSHFRAQNVLRLGSTSDVIGGSGIDACSAIQRLKVKQGHH